MNDVSEKAVAAVEAANSKGFWVAVPNGQFIGEKDEVGQKARQLMDAYITAGWPKDEIRVSISVFTKRVNINSPEE